MRIPFFFKLVFNKYFFQKLFAILLLAVFVYFLESFLLVFLITFLFSYLFLDAAETIQSYFSHLFSSAKGKSGIVAKLLSSEKFIITVIYGVFITVVVSLFYTLIPHLLEEGKSLIHNAPTFADQVQNAIASFEDSTNIDLGLNKAIGNFFNPTSVENLVKTTFEHLQNIGIFLMEVLIALVLSFVFLMDRSEITSYLEDVKKGNFSFLYDEFKVIFGKIAKGFGLIFKAQAFIALVNACLTIVGLFLISLVHGGTAFPYIITLGVIVFIFGFVPVLGTFMSSFPILLIGYNYGGIHTIFAIMAMIAFIHVVESYYLNPKIVSAYMQLPVFVTFLVLLVSEHLFGFIGLLIGVPIFYILMDLLKDFDHFVTKIQHAHATLHDAQDETKNSIRSAIRMSRSGKREGEE